LPHREHQGIFWPWNYMKLQQEDDSGGRVE
jgi:hypothetical protein